MAEIMSIRRKKPNQSINTSKKWYILIKCRILFFSVYSMQVIWLLFSLILSQRFVGGRENCVSCIHIKTQTKCPRIEPNCLNLLIYNRFDIAGKIENMHWKTKLFLKIINCTLNFSKCSRIACEMIKCYKRFPLKYSMF